MAVLCRYLAPFSVYLYVIIPEPVYAGHTTGSVAEWLALVTLVHMPQRTGGSRFERFGLGSYRWILGEFSSGVYPTVSHLLIQIQTCHPWRSPLV